MSLRLSLENPWIVAGVVSMQLSGATLMQQLGSASRGKPTSALQASPEVDEATAKIVALPVGEFAGTTRLERAVYNESEFGLWVPIP